MGSPKRTRCSTMHHVMSPSPSSHPLPAPHVGYLFLVVSALLLAIGTYALLFSAAPFFPALAPSSGGGGDRWWWWWWPWPTSMLLLSSLDALARDTHYKYLALFSVPVCAYFVIANWVGWQFFRNS